MKPPYQFAAQGGALEQQHGSQRYDTDSGTDDRGIDDPQGTAQKQDQYVQ